MKIPNKCPFCNNVLLNTNKYINFGTEWLHKTCLNFLDHKFSIIENGEGKVIRIVIYKPSLKYSIHWSLLREVVFISNSNIEVLSATIKAYIPWFEPDFSDCNALINKVKTYMTFI